jgi:asparagine synthase (glutamine-hydrolysing)
MAETPALAGVICRRQAADADAELAVLERALAGEGSVTARRAHSASLAWTGAALAVDGGALCLLCGSVYAGAAGAAEQGILAAWRAGEPAPPASLRGDFALVLWDETRERGLLACDQLGERSLFWHDDGVRLCFATDVHLVLGLLRRRPDPDDSALAHWLAISDPPGGRTLYAGVRRLPAGHLLELGADAPARARRWWKPQYTGVLDGDADELAGRVRVALTDAVARRVTASEPSALLLSGGLDSASVAGVAATLHPDLRPSRAYSATFPNHPAADESRLIALLAERLSVDSTRVAVRAGSVLAGTLRYLERWSVPPRSPNLFFWTPLLECAAADGVRSMLDGEGGDELFGPSPYLAADWVARGRVRDAIGLSMRVPGTAGQREWRWKWWFLRTFGLMGLAPRFLHTASRAVRNPRRYVPAWLGPEATAAFAAIAEGAPWKEGDGPRWWRWRLWTASAAPGRAAVHDHSRHRSAMAGIAPRHPLIDLDIVELVLRLPPELAFDARLPRPLLRAGMAGLLPDEVRLRSSKSRFDALFHDALAGPDLGVVRHLLGPGAHVGQYVDLDRVRTDLLERVPAGNGREWWALQVWRLLTAECWLRAQEDPAAPRRAAEAVGLPDADCRIDRAPAPAGA